MTKIKRAIGLVFWVPIAITGLIFLAAIDVCQQFCEEIRGLKKEC